jgi:hypothetical protein
MKSISLPYEHNSERQPSELKKVVVGFIYTFAVEIIFFLIAAACMAVMWYLFFHCLRVSDHQKVYLYDPYEVKYLTIVIGGYKRTIAVKRYFKNHNIICH